MTGLPSLLRGLGIRTALPGGASLREGKAAVLAGRNSGRAGGGDAGAGAGAGAGVAALGCALLLSPRMKFLPGLRVAPFARLRAPWAGHCVRFAFVSCPKRKRRREREREKETKRETPRDQEGKRHEERKESCRRVRGKEEEGEDYERTCGSQRGRSREARSFFPLFLLVVGKGKRNFEKNFNTPLSVLHDARTRDRLAPQTIFWPCAVALRGSGSVLSSAQGTTVLPTWISEHFQWRSHCTR